MPLPSDITSEHVRAAIALLNNGHRHRFGPSTRYDVLVDGHRYSPKTVLGLAASLANGKELGPEDFSGGYGDRQANTVLERLGFTIIEKNPLSRGAPAGSEVSTWFEYTFSGHQHGGSGWEFGTCLWSPTTNSAGADFYSAMREPKPGDLVIHCQDQVIVGESIVADRYRKSAEAPPTPGDWEGANGYYRINLRGFRTYAKSIPLGTFLAQYQTKIRHELQQGRPAHYPFVTYGKNALRVRQGAYLSKLTPSLILLVREATRGGALGAQPEKSQYWIIAAGEGGRFWPEFQEKGIVAIGFDEAELGDLTQYPTKGALQRAIKERSSREGEPVNDALAAYEFSRQMRPGDFIFVRQGRSLIVGLGRISSEYRFEPQRSEYRHVRNVEWEKRGAWALDENRLLALKTLTNKTEDLELVEYLLLHMALDSGEAPTELSAPLYSIDDALEHLFIDRGELDRMLEALARKQNIVLSGPPGVGKTFAAKRLAYALAGYKDPHLVEMVQFHQSYSYEDFIQGWRPAPEGGFYLQDGVFLRFCARARARPDTKFVFIIDEINRGNLSKIFGELLMLIEADKRGDDFSIPLTYSSRKDAEPDRFSIPPNLYLIGIMNTADRSLAMVDYALRRRFGFITLKPAFRHPKFLTHLSRAGATPELVSNIISRVEKLNSMIRGDTANLGPGFEIGHSYFVPTGGERQLDRDWYESVVRWEVEPLLQEYWFDDPDKVSTLTAGLLE